MQVPVNEIRTMPSGGTVYAVAFSPDGKTVSGLEVARLEATLNFGMLKQSKNSKLLVVIQTS